MIDNRFIKEFEPESMNIAVCGSMSSKTDWLVVVRTLEQHELSVSTPDLTESSNWSNLSEPEKIERKGYYIRRHIANIARASAVLVCNFSKGERANYIGSNTFLEIAVAYAYEKPIYILNDLPQQNNRDEILALNPTILNGDLSRMIDSIKESVIAGGNVK